MQQMKSNKEFRLRNSRAAARLQQQPNYDWRGMRILAERFCFTGGIS